MADIVATFEIRYRRAIDPAGKPVGALPAFATPQKLVALYRALTRTRAFHDKAVALHRTARLDTCSPSLAP